MSRRLHASAVAAMAAAAAVCCAGCFGASREFNALQRDVATSLNVTVEETQSFGFGRLSLGMARGMLGLAAEADDPDADLAARMIGMVRSLEVGCYQIQNNGHQHGMTSLRQIDEVLANAGMETMIRHVDEGELVTIYIQIKRNRLRQMLIVSVDDTEMTLVRLRGRLDEAVALALNSEF